MPRLSDADKHLLSRSVTPDDIIDDIPASIPPAKRNEPDSADERLDKILTDALEMSGKIAKGKGTRKQKKQEVAQPDEPINGDAEGNEDEFEVESIVDHQFQKKKCLYRVRWKGWSEADDTWEPEKHLLPEAASILAAYQKKIGGTPQPPKQVRKTASKAQLAEQRSGDDEPESQPNKRQKRAHRTSSGVPDSSSKEWKQEPLSAWQPADKGSWEDLVHEVETVERDDNGNLHAFIRFRNGKRSKVANNVYVNRCPRAMLKFYESHLSV